MNLKSAVYSTARALGLFEITRRLTARGVRVLCYHGVVADDDDLAAFAPKLFMRRSTLESRLDRLERAGAKVISLDEAFRQIRELHDVRDAVVLTFDDGWHGTFDIGVPLLAERGIPCTIYVSSYYAVTAQPVFNVAVQYLFWKWPVPPLDFSQTEFQASSEQPLVFAPSDASRALVTLIDLGNRLNSAQRSKLLLELANRFGGPASEAMRSRRLSLATIDELRAAVGPLVSLQLHTHRHTAPDADRAAFAREIEDNRRALEAAGATGLRHFCYPSGQFSPSHFEWLRELRVDSASTTIPGRWTAADNVYLVPRFVDSDAYSDTLFEAELFGFQDLLRRTRRVLTLGASSTS
jgi:peptidoglycan/xylan/chitin deacetylase (PgdA/CDA1 family)